MSVVFLNGASSPTDAAHSLSTAVQRRLGAQFEPGRTFHLAGHDIGHCMGEFDCFVKSPGRCRIHDEGPEIERAVHDAELVVLVTPLHYLGCAAPLKKVADRLLPLISPFDGSGPAFTLGRLDAPTLAAVLGDADLLSIHRVMVCGPDAMRVAVRVALFAGGLPADRLFEESFVSPRRGAVSGQAQLAVFESSDGEQAITLPPGDTLLDAALNAGIALPFSCCSGGCGACRVHVTELLDHVVLDAPNTVTPEDRSRGEMRACLVRLTGPCRLRLP